MLTSSVVFSGGTRHDASRANDRAFADAIRATLPNMHFEPASLDKQNVRQIVPLKLT